MEESESGVPVPNGEQTEFTPDQKERYEYLKKCNNLLNIQILNHHRCRNSTRTTTRTF
jgi:hypothetical protein